MYSSQESNEGHNAEGEKKGLFGKWKAKISQTREERQAEKERAKSPPRNEYGTSRSSLNAFAQEHLAQRGRSFDRAREETLPGVIEKPTAESQAQDSKPAPEEGGN